MPSLLSGLIEDGMATEDEEDETVLPPAQMQAEPAGTAVAAQNAAQAVATVKAEEQQERTRLEENAIGTYACASQLASCPMVTVVESPFSNVTV